MTTKTKFKLDEGEDNDGLPPWQWRDPETEEVYTFARALDPRDALGVQTPFDKMPPLFQEQYGPELAGWRRLRRQAFDQRKAAEAREDAERILGYEAADLATPAGWKRLKERIEALEAHDERTDARLDALETPPH